VFRANGFDPETIERDLGDAIRQAVTVPAKADLPAAPAAH
jgi:hypothetical protein